MKNNLTWKIQIIMLRARKENGDQEMNTWIVELDKQSEKFFENGVNRDLFNKSLSVSKDILTAVYQENEITPCIGLAENGTVAIEWFGTEYEMLVQTDADGHTEVYREQVGNRSNREAFDLVFDVGGNRLMKIRNWLSRINFFQPINPSIFDSSSDNPLEMREKQSILLANKNSQLSN